MVFKSLGKSVISARFRLSAMMFLGLLFLSGGSSLADVNNTAGSGANINSVIAVNVTENLTDLIPIGGKVAAKKSVVLAAQLPGRVIKINGEEGDFFKKDSVLLKLDTKELMAKRREAEAQWSSAYAAWQNAYVQRNQIYQSPGLSRNTPGGMGMPGMFDQFFTEPMAEMMGTREFDVERGARIVAGNTQLKQARDALDQVRANIEQIDSKLRDSKSIAPFDGVIVVKHVEVGDTIQPGQPMLGFEDASQLQIVSDVPVKLAHGLQEGDELSARLDVGNIKTSVTVDNVFPKADPAQHTVKVKFNLPANTLISAGTYAEVFIPDPKSKTTTSAIIIPETAIAQRGGLPVVFIVDESNKVSIRLVRLGQQLSNNRRVIKYGLSAGDLLVNYPSSNLVTGTVLPAGSMSTNPKSQPVQTGTAQNINQ